MSKQEQQEQQEILDFAYGLAEEAIRLIVKGQNARWQASNGVDEKKNSVDLVTPTDQTVEKMIKDAIQAHFPSHKFIGEEAYAVEGKLELTDDYTWIVDPVDGTMNFVHSFPQVGCSIGITYKKVPVVGVLALPFMGQIYSARQGGGAFMNRTIPLPLTGGVPQPLTRLRDCLIAVEMGSGRTQDVLVPMMESFARLSGDPDKGVAHGQMAHGIRLTGSTVCNLAAVISGQMDVYWYAGMHAWDICAGMAILRETGGYFQGGAKAFARKASDEEILLGRRCVAVRAVPGTQEEKAVEIQERLIKELYDVVVPWTRADMRDEE